MIDVAWAQGVGGSAPPTLVSFLPIAIIFVVFYILLIRPQQQKAKEHKVMLSNLKRNDDIITSGGLYGKVIQLADDVVTVEIAPNVRVRVSRPQISTVLGAGKPAENKNPEKEKDKTK
jgi:preprotein translocase subunit YajC